MKRAVLAAYLVACGGDGVDLCSDTTRATCLAVTVTSNMDLEIDTLELDILQGEFHESMSTMGVGNARLPVTTAIYDMPVSTEPLVISAAGKLFGAVLAVGWARTTSPQVEIEIASVPPDCAAGALYCGTSPDGDLGVLYKCDADRVPIARGRCQQTCTPREGDDTCTHSEPCLTGTYCGGNKVEGDPQSLFTCNNGVATLSMVCVTRCLIRPGDDDRCE